MSHRHEDRFTAGLQIAAPGLEVHQELTIPRKARDIDLLYVYPEPHPTWGPFAELLSDRPVLIEHYSDSPGLADLFNAHMKLTWLAETWLRGRSRKTRRPSDLPESLLRTSRGPILVIAAAQIDRRALDAYPGVHRTRPRSVWKTREESAGAIVAFDLNDLPKQPGYAFLRWLATPSTPQLGRWNFKRLLEDPTLPTVLKQRLKEAVMAEAIPVHPMEKKSAYQLAVEEGEMKGRREGKLEGKLEGRLEGRREDLIRIVAVRGLQLDAAQRQRVEQCDDGGRLVRWIERAAVADSADDVFEA